MSERSFARIAALLLLSVLALASTVPSSTWAAAAAQGHDTAREALAQAVAALGGMTAVSAGGRLSFTHEGTVHSAEQARNPAQPVTEDARRNSYVIDRVNRRLRLESRTIFPGELEFSALLVLDGGAGFAVDPLGWRIGTDIVRIPAGAAAASFEAGTRILPHLLVMQAMAHDSTLQDGGVQEVEGERYRSIDYRDVSGAGVSVYLDLTTSLVRGYAVRRGQARSLVLFDEFRAVNGLQVPHATRSFAGGQPLERLRISSIAMLPSVPDSLFAVPAGFSDPPPTGEPRVMHAGGGVYSLEDMPDAYRSMFVDMGDHLIVLEAPVSPAYGEAALRMIEETLPGKPIRYVLVTHHHGDHTGGLGPFVARGATIVAGAGAATALRRQLADAGDALRIEEVSSVRTFGTGSRRIEVHPLPNAHADGSLVFHLPGRRLLFQGDLLYVPVRGPVPAAFPAAVSLARFIEGQRLAVDSIAGVHGRTASRADLSRAIELRRGPEGVTRE